jgi:hypothetical protein
MNWGWAIPILAVVIVLIALGRAIITGRGRR